MRYSNLLNVEGQFIGEGQEHIPSKFESMFRPDKARLGVRSPGGSKELGKMCEFVLSRDEKTLEIAKAGPYRVRILSCASRSCGGTYCTTCMVEEGYEEGEEIPITKLDPSRKRVANPKGKSVASSLRK